MAQSWTIETAAEAVGIHPKHLQRIETGRGSRKDEPPNVTLASLVAAAVAYHIDLAELFAEAMPDVPVLKKPPAKKTGRR